MLKAWQGLLDTLHTEGGFIAILLGCWSVSIICFVFVDNPDAKEFFKGRAYEFTGALLILITSRLGIVRGGTSAPVTTTTTTETTT